MGLSTKAKRIKSLKNQLKKVENTNPKMAEGFRLKIQTLENDKK